MKRSVIKFVSLLTVLAMFFAVQISLPTGITVNAAASGVWPTESRFKNITTYFDGGRNVSDVSGYHNGIDIEANGGSSIFAAYGGQVTSAGWMDGYGYMVILRHADLGVYTFYAHASNLLVSTGMTVKAGDAIAQVGSTGNSSGNHLHFGICDTLQAGWPARTYYDPLTYFSYSGNTGGGTAVAEPECSCTDECAGLYTTKGVVTDLNIRSGHSTSSAVIGGIPAGAEFNVTKGNGEWAHVEYNGVKGYVSAVYIQPKAEQKSDISITGATAPEGNLPKGKPFSLRGNIVSAFIITKVSGGVYFRSGVPTKQVMEVAPNSVTYSLSGEFDNSIVFNDLDDGEYTYKVTAVDEKGQSFELISSDFTVGNVTATPAKVTGDINGDKKADADDVKLLQGYLLGKSDGFSKENSEAADINKDGKVDVYDLVELRKTALKSAQ